MAQGSQCWEPPSLLHQSSTHRQKPRLPSLLAPVDVFRARCSVLKAWLVSYIFMYSWFSHSAMKYPRKVTQQGVAHFVCHTAWGSRGHHCRRRHGRWSMEWLIPLYPQTGSRERSNVVQPALSSYFPFLTSLGPQSMGWCYQYSEFIYPQLGVCAET